MRLAPGASRGLWVWGASTVVLAGATVLALEILGARLLAPRFGSGIYSWTSLIAVALLGLAAGSWIGGRLADCSGASPVVLVAALGTSSVLTEGAVVFAPSVLRLAGELVGMRFGSLLAAAVLFLAPITLLGTSVPFVVRMLAHDGMRLGTVVGGLSTLSTAGGLVGALGTGLVLVPELGVEASMHVAALLAMLPVLACPWIAKPRTRRSYSASATLALAFGGALIVSSRRAGGEGPRVIYQRESLLGSVVVVERPDNDLRLMLIDGACQTATSLEPPFESRLAYGRLIERVLPQLLAHGSRILVVGLGGGTLPARMEGLGFDVHVVEFDPIVVQAAERGFGFDTRAVELTLADGRVFLESWCGTPFEAIVIDAAGGGTQPWHLMTREAFAAARKVLEPRQGLLLFNLITTDSQSSAELLGGMRHTLEEAFPHVGVVRPKGMEAVDVKNNVWIAALAPQPAQRFENLAIAAGARPQATPLLGPLLTDDHCPVNLLVPEVDYRWRALSLESAGWARGAFGTTLSREDEP